MYRYSRFTVYVKNVDYGEAQRYLIFKHDKINGKPMDSINSDAFTFDVECMEVNGDFGKSQNYDDIQSHHYIISYDPMDATDRETYC